MVEGAFYRITDYVTTSNGYTITTGEPSRSAGHAFDIIIQATGASNLADIGTAALHSGDTYFANENLGAWQIWYDIENNTTKYLWADTTNGKGVIYRMIDEMKNDLPYDFKNIQFYRDGSATKYSAVASYLTASDGYYYTFSYNNNGTISDMSVAYSNFCSGNVISSGYAINMGYALNNSIWIVTNSTHQICDNSFESNFHDNIFCNLNYSNHFGAFCYNNIFANQTYNNTFGSSCKDNVIKTTFNANIIGHYFYSNTFSNASASCGNNFIAGVFYSNTINGNFNNNQLGSYTYDNTWTGNCNNSRIASYFYNNSFGGNFTAVTGPGFFANTVTGNVSNMVFGSYIRGNNITGVIQNSVIGSYFYNNVSSSSIVGCSIGCMVYNLQAAGLNFVKIGDYVCNTKFPVLINAWYIDNGIQGSSATNKLDMTGIDGGSQTSYKNVYITRDVNNGIVAKWNDGANETGLYKATVTTSSWSDLLPTYTWET